VVPFFSADLVFAEVEVSFVAIRQAIRRFTERLIHVVTTILLTIGLFVVYFVGIAATRIVATVFFRNRLYFPRKDEERGWRVVHGYHEDMTAARRQS